MVEEVHGYMTANDYSYKQIKENARKNRQQMTHAERMLWDKLKSKQLGIHFRRQHIIGNYIADFVCLRNNIVIEIDGGYHGNPEQVKADAYRDWYLQEHGFKVLHFTNDQVEKNVEDVVTTIIHNL